MAANLIQTLDGHTDRLWTLAWNPSGTILASSGCDKDIRLWAETNSKWNCVSILAGTHNKSIRRLCWSPCGDYLASASFDATVCIWKKSADGSWTTLVNLDGHDNEVKSVAWSADGKYLASCGRDRMVWIWERAASEDNGGDDYANWDCSDLKNDHTKDVKHLIWHPNHNILVSCSYDDTIKFFHMNEENDGWKCFETLSSHTSTVWSLDFSASGEFLATCSDDRTVRVWKNHAHEKLPSVEPFSWKCTSVIQGYHRRVIYDISWCKITDTIVSAGGDNSLVFYARSSEETNDGDTFVCIDKLNQAHNCDINSVAWNPKVPGLLASASDDATINLWLYNKGKGMTPASVLDEILLNLTETFKGSLKCSQEGGKSSESECMINITDFSHLLTLVQCLQHLQNEIYLDEERSLVGKMLDLRITDANLPPILLSNLCLEPTDGSVREFCLDIIDNKSEVKYRYKVLIDQTKFALHIPRRSIKFFSAASELFLIEKTGDLYRVSKTGVSEFLLGHLFSLTDIKLVTTEDGKKISLVISADRDEKIRISRYPNTFEIERFCFGHRHLIKRLILVDEKSFISVDQQQSVCLWDLKQLDSSCDNALSPVRTTNMDRNDAKRVCIRALTPNVDRSQDTNLAV